MFESDAAFVIGKTHKVCQDYAIVAGRDSAPRSVWLSDGCSSSPNTDVGARLITHGVQQRLTTFRPAVDAENSATSQKEFETLIRKCLRSATRTGKSLGVPPDFLDATLLGLVSEQDSVYAVLYGDGAAVFGRDDGMREVYRAHYGAGYPFYPAYLADRGRCACWRDVPGNEHTITKTTLFPDGRVGETRKIPADAPWFFLRQPVKGLRFAAVLSDGIESFQNRIETETCSTFRPVDYLWAVQELTAFKNFNGEFVHRRLQSFEKECFRQGRHHNDDISLAAMSFEKE